MNKELQTAARHFVQPVDDRGIMSPMYGDWYTGHYYRTKYGDKVWEDACEKARIEYRFGTSAVKW